MQFSSFQEFIAMGGYGFFVWLSYGCTLLAVGGLVIRSVTRRRALLADVRRQLARQQRIAAAGQRDITASSSSLSNTSDTTESTQ